VIPHGMPCLAGLTDHESLKSFFMESWDKLPRVAVGASLPWLGSLMDLTDVEGFMASLPVPTQSLMSLIAGGAREPGRECRSADGFINLGAIHQLFSEGMSFVLTKMHKRHPFTGRLCRALETDLVKGGLILTERIGANLYLTPPQAQALDPHFDFHHVLVIQLEGQKHWKIWTQHHQVNNPKHEGGVDKNALGSPILEPNLKPGDVLYIPRGCPHEAGTAESHSLHLTLSMTPVSWNHLLGTALEDHHALNQPLPPFFDASDLGPLAQIETLLHQRLGDAYRHSQETFAMNLSQLPGEGFAMRYQTLVGDTLLKLAPGSLPILRVDATQVHLTLQGSRFSLPKKALTALELICTGTSFKPHSLPELSTQEALTLAKTLQQQGCLCVVCAN